MITARCWQNAFYSWAKWAQNYLSGQTRAYTTIWSLEAADREMRLCREKLNFSRRGAARLPHYGFNHGWLGDALCSPSDGQVEILSNGWWMERPRASGGPGRGPNREPSRWPHCLHSCRQPANMFSFSRITVPEWELFFSASNRSHARWQIKLYSNKRFHVLHARRKLLAPFFSASQRLKILSHFMDVYFSERASERGACMCNICERGCCYIIKWCNK